MRMLALMLVHRWGRGAVGSAPRWHRGGRGFESHRLHQNSSRRFPEKSRRKFSFAKTLVIVRTWGAAVLRPYVFCSEDRLGGGGDGVEFARGFPQRDVGFEFAHHFFEGGEVEGLGAVADGFFGVR